MTGVAKKSFFSLTDVAIKLPGDVDWLDIPWVIGASYKGSHAVVEVVGDDAHQMNLHHTQKGQITVKANQAAMAVLEKVTGVSSSSSGGFEKINMHQDEELSAPPFLAVRAKTRAVSTTSGTATMYWYKCSCTTTFEQFLDLQTGKLCELTLTFDAFMSDNDENGVAMAKRCFGRVEVPTA